MADKDDECKEIVIIDAFNEIEDSKLKIKIDNAVTQIIMNDPRFSKAQLETVDALRDWVRAEAVLNRAFKEFMDGKSDASTERMLRAMFIQKNALRDEIFGKFVNKKTKEKEISEAEKIMIDQHVIEPGLEVDMLAKRKPS